MRKLSLGILLILNACSTTQSNIEVWKASHTDEGLIRKQGKVDFIPASDIRFSGFYCVSEGDLKSILDRLNK